MMTGWPHFADSFSPISRAVMSVAPPGANGTTIFTARDGYGASCACTSEARRSTRRAILHVGTDPMCCRYWCTNAIAMLPSPTAEATRLIGLSRTSPQAKMPGTLVSSRNGSRSCDQRPAFAHVVAGQHVAARVARDSAGSHRCRASAPMNTNRPPQSWRVTVPVAAVGDVDRRRDGVAVRRRHFASQPHGDVRLAARAARSGSATCSSRASRRARAASPGARGWRRTAPPGRPSCRRRSGRRRGRA